MLGSVLSTCHILTHLTLTSIQRDRYCYYHHTPYKETEVQSSVTCPLRNGSGISIQTLESMLSTIILPPASFPLPFFLGFPIPRIGFHSHCPLPHVHSSAPNLEFLLGLFFLSLAWWRTALPLPTSHYCFLTFFLGDCLQLSNHFCILKSYYIRARSCCYNNGLTSSK